MTYPLRLPLPERGCKGESERFYLQRDTSGLQLGHESRQQRGLLLHVGLEGRVFRLESGLLALAGLAVLGEQGRPDGLGIPGNHHFAPLDNGAGNHHGAAHARVNRDTLRPLEDVAERLGLETDHALDAIGSRDNDGDVGGTALVLVGLLGRFGGHGFVPLGLVVSPGFNFREPGLYSLLLSQSFADCNRLILWSYSVGSLRLVTFTILGGALQAPFYR